MVHPAVVERRSFWIMAFERHVTGRHVTNPNYCQVANFAFCDEALNVLVVPSVPIKQIDRHQTVPRFNLSYQLPFCGYVGA